MRSRSAGPACRCCWWVCEGKNNGSFASKYFLLGSEPLFLDLPPLAGPADSGYVEIQLIAPSDFRPSASASR